MLCRLSAETIKVALSIISTACITAEFCVTSPDIYVLPLPEIALLLVIPLSVKLSVLLIFPLPRTSLLNVVLPDVVTTSLLANLTDNSTSFICKLALLLLIIALPELSVRSTLSMLNLEEDVKLKPS